MNQQTLQGVKQPNVSLDKTTPMICENCGSHVFREAIFIRKVSKFLAGTDQDAIVPIPTFCCAKCGHVNSELTPQGLKSEQE
jgi:hypothetical protein